MKYEKYKIDELGLNAESKNPWSVRLGWLGQVNLLRFNYFGLREIRRPRSGPRTKIKRQTERERKKRTMFIKREKKNVNLN